MMIFILYSCSCCTTGEFDKILNIDATSFPGSLNFESTVVGSDRTDAAWVLQLTHA
jgi:hypothetical protein